MPTFQNADGSVSQYGLVCGYIDRHTRKLASGKTVDFDLEFNGCTYDVTVTGYTEAGDVELRGWVSQLCGESCTHSAIYGHSKFWAGWAQFDSLTEARKFKRRIMRMNTYADVMVACAGVMLQEGLVAGHPEQSIAA